MLSFLVVRKGLKFYIYINCTEIVDFVWGGKGECRGKGGVKDR